MAPTPKQSSILVASQDEAVLSMFMDLMDQSKMDYSACRSLDTFFSSCWRSAYSIGILDLSLFNYHKVNLPDILKTTMVDLKMVIIYSDDLHDREIIEANLAQKIIYRLVKPFSQNEAQAIVNVIKGIV